MSKINATKKDLEFTISEAKDGLGLAAEMLHQDHILFTVILQDLMEASALMPGFANRLDKSIRMADLGMRESIYWSNITQQTKDEVSP